MSPRIQNTEELREALKQKLNELKEAFDADVVTLHLYDPQRERLYFPVGVNLLQERRFMQGVPSMDRVAGKVVRSQLPIVANYAEHHPDMTGPFTHMEKIKAAAGFPLLVPDSGEVMGVLFVDYRHPHHFADGEVENIEVYSSDLAEFINRVLQGDQGRVLRDVLRMETDLRLADARLRGIVDRLWSILGDVDIALWTREPGEQDLRVKMHKGLSLGFANHASVNHNTDGSNLVSVAFVDEEEVLVENPQTDPRAAFNVAAPVAWKYMLAVPVSSEYQQLGVLCVFRREQLNFTRRERELVRAFAALMAITIENEERITALHALHDVGVRLTLTTSLEEILGEVVRSACQVFDADTSTVHLYDPVQQTFYDLEHSAVFPPQARSDMEKPRNKGGVSAQIIDKGRIYCEDIRAQKDPIMRSTFVREQAVQSYVGTPLISVDEPLGVLYISFKEKRRFPPEDLALVQMLANYASTAIYRAELLNQRAAVTEIARDITSVLDRDKLLQQTLERSLEILSCEFGSISVFDPESQLLRFRYAVGKPSNMHVEMGEGLIGTAAETRMTVRVADVSKDKRYVEHIGETRSELDVPMLVGNRLVGVLNAESSRLNAFSEEDEQLAVALAAQAAVAFHTAELYEEAQARLQERVDDIQALQGIYALIGTAPTEDMLQEIAEEAARLTPAKYTGLWLLDERAGDLQFGAMNERAEAAAQRPPGLSLDESSISGHVALTGETYRCDDVREDPYYQPWYEDTRSELATPLIHGDEVIGILNLESTEVGAFTEDHERLVEALAGAAVVAAHLYEQFERRVEELAALNEVGQTLTSGIRLDENQILELIHEQAKKLTGAQDMYIALYDEGTNVIRFGLATEHGERVDYEAREADMDERGKTEEVIFTRQPILHRTLEESKAWYGQPGHQEFIGRIQSSYLGVPLVAGEKVLGMIALYDWDREYAYDGRDLQTFSSMAGQAAIALDNATLYYDVIQRLEALNEVGQTLTSGIRLGEDEILELIYEQAKKLTGAQDMYIALYDEGTNLIRFGLATEHGERVDYEAREAGMDERGKTEEVIFTRQPILHRTLEESKAWYGQPGHQEFIGRVAPSWLGVPLVAGEKVLGMIALYDWDREYAYDGRDLQTFSSMAGQAAIALDNASLLEETRKLRDEVIATKQLATLGTAIAALQHRISNTFNIIVPNVTRLRRRVDMTDETIVEILDIIERNARYTSEIVTRIQEPLREVKIQDVNVNGVLDEVIGITEEQWPDVVIEQNLDDDIPLIQAPIGQVAEVFRNLSDNACRAMDGNGRLVITSCLDGGIISVRVRDMGSGIPPRIQERLFERPVPSKVPGGGAGLGLWLGQLMLQTIGGEVEIERTDSTGTTMLVRIPASGAEGGVQL